MKIRLNGTERAQFEDLVRTQENNARALSLTSAYLIRRARWVTPGDMDAVTACGVTDEQAYTALMAAGMGLDSQDNPADRRMELDYVAPAVRKLDEEEYRSNPYYKNIRVPEKTVGVWRLGTKKYAPYEAFVRNDLRLYRDFREVPQIGFFEGEFAYPAVMENDNEWMTVTPNEIETMKEAVGKARGKVAAFGLGLGYFAYMAGEKQEVEKVTIIERDESVISLFEECILPQFGHQEKIEIVRADAFEFAEKEMAGRGFDMAFVDLWHDVSDGTGLYLRMKRLEERAPGTEFVYWIEKSLLSHLRFHLFWRMEEAVRKGADDELSGLLGIEEISSAEQIEELLSDESLRELAARLEDIGRLKGDC